MASVAGRWGHRPPWPTSPPLCVLPATRLDLVPSTSSIAFLVSLPLISLATPSSPPNPHHLPPSSPPLLTPTSPSPSPQMSIRGTTSSPHRPSKSITSALELQSVVRRFIDWRTQAADNQALACPSTSNPEQVRHSQTPPIPDESIQLVEETPSSSSGYSSSPPPQKMNRPIDLSDLLTIPGASRGRGRSAVRGGDRSRVPCHLMAAMDPLNWTPFLAFLPRN
ncbi:hypothetical protein RHSIM_Rhsim13G0133300 [Rhododendron simsii]|uniref:Uncharacterized protein n=1 Tax=Rhododendron simsii TaxID=118357 RepID=A0A834L6R9_RHOSS|nr:hypothetical protein RHSIM_Rhsim13G0133300 [Rhododendron simsii]